jgi:hypothetical protein
MQQVTHSQELEQLRKLTNELLDQTRPFYSLRAEVLEIKSILQSCGGLAVDSNEDIALGESKTPAGIALSPTMAAMCMDDFGRTVQFIRGIEMAIRDVGKRLKHRSVRVLYAGCGPLAPLALPLMTILPVDAARFTLLDIHAISTACVRRLIQTLGLQEGIISIETIDAVKYEIDPAEPPDIIIVEMLRAGLEAEPQAAVGSYLMKKVPEAVMIPAEIRVDLVLMDLKRQIDGGVSEINDVTVGTVLKLDAGAYLNEELITRKSRLLLPPFDKDRYLPMLFTEVDTYGNHRLRRYDSGITVPRRIQTKREITGGDALEFQYLMGDMPGLQVKTSTA